VNHFKRATSLGGTESLIEHRKTVEGAFGNSPGNLIRISVGLEDVNDLIADLNNALSNNSSDNKK
jgi:cystathionine gamma-synthase